ncbi:MAG TPA: cupin domain-containing protein [Terriglobales bacterium]|nr:cupin domain-containing protein [Terriglobales bacterium]
MNSALLSNTMPEEPAPPSKEPRHTRWQDVALEPIKPLIDRQVIVGDNIMMARVLLKRGASVPRHSHLNEQVTYILEGALKFLIQNKEIVVAAGEVLTIPAGIPHEAVALEDTIDLDVFTPPRMDWMMGTDTYLRS